MKKNRKRLMAAFMAVLMVLTLVPTWLLGGIFATTAKADDDVTLGYTFKEADLSKDKSSSSAEIKDGDGIVYEVTAVKGRLWICQNICKKRLYKDKYRLLYRKYR